MPIETICPGCGRKLRVADEHAGRQARCPLCNTIYTAPGEATLATMPDVGPGGAGANRDWKMRTPEGQTYGPVSKQELDRWVVEGRVTADCQVHSENLGWCNADSLYSALRSAPGPGTPRGSPFSEPVASRGKARRFAAQNRSPVPAGTRYAAHRGGLILALGIISWVAICPIFGIIAWVMATSDLREMRQGRMDPAGMGLTQAGQVLGMIHAIILVVLIALVLFLILLAVATS